MSVGFDKKTIHNSLLFCLPFREGVGILTQDTAKPHHEVVLQDPGGGSFNWGNLPTGRPYLEFVTVGFGANDGVYLECPAAETVDLNFTAGDYSIGVWVNHVNTGHFNPKIIVGRYGVDLDGWEIYLETDVGPPVVHYLEHRHHHAPDRDGCYSTGWTPGSGWALLGISRHKVGGTSYPQHFRNGIPLEMSYAVGGLLDPTTCNRDLVVGARFTKDADWYKGILGQSLRIWGMALETEDWRYIFHSERQWFAA